MGIAMKFVAFVFAKNAQNSSTRTIGKRIDIEYHPNLNILSPSALQ